MLGTELTAGILFLQQLGLALAGAACLWGLFFSVNTDNATEEGRKKIFQGLTQKLFISYIFGFCLAAFAWIVRLLSRSSYIGPNHIFANLSDASAYVRGGIPLLWFAFLVFSAFLILMYTFRREKFFAHLHSIYLVGFIAVFILISFPTGFDILDNRPFFFIEHGFPLIFTVGTVMIVDFIFFFTRSSLRAKRQIFPYLPTLNKLVWVGLSVNFFGDWLTGTALKLTPNFFFTEVVIAVIIINGMIFTGPLLEALISGVSERRVKPLERKWGIISGISGVLSFSSWTTLTLIAFYPDLSLSFSALFYIYAGKLIFFYLCYLALEYLTDIPVSFVNTN